METTTRRCIHLDQQLRWFGYRQDHGRKFYIFQCLGCGKTFFSRTSLLIKGVTGPAAKVTGLGSL